jgi:hypothetical protein
MSRNWVDEILDNAVATVQAWPDWMKRPEFRSPEGRLSFGYQIHPIHGYSITRPGAKMKCTRCGETDHERSPDGEPAGNNCRKAKRERETDRGRKSHVQHLNGGTSVAPINKQTPEFDFSELHHFITCAQDSANKGHYYLARTLLEHVQIRCAETMNAIPVKPPQAPTKP